MPVDVSCLSAASRPAASFVGSALADLSTRGGPQWRTLLGSLVGFAAVLAGCGSGTPVAVVPPPADAEPGRWVFLDGAQNTRDVGGYTAEDDRSVRRTTVYRSATLSHVTGDGCEAFADLGVVTVIDFRNRFSTSPLFDGDVICIHQSAHVVGLPISFSTDVPGERQYVVGVEDHVEAYRRAFEQIADPANLPLLFHCAAGKDRSGVMAAMLLTLLGVDRATVIADFRLSEEIGESVNLPALETLLDAIEDVGGIETYLAAIGVSPETQTVVRDNLLE